MPLRSIRLVLEYDGTRYFGWQAQEQSPTIQQSVEGALERILGERVILHGSGRTDRGAHALGQVAHFLSSTALPPLRIQAALNALLPPDIAAVEVSEAGEDFHARYSARSKVYRYRILNRRARPALERDRTWHVPGPLDLDRMRSGAIHLIGEHDFRAFRKEGGSRSSAVRTVIAIEISRRGEEVTIEVEATGFLYTMVRSVVGSLVRVGRGDWEPEAIRDILASGDRVRVGPQTAPARGLCLVRVKYDPPAGDVEAAPADA